MKDDAIALLKQDHKSLRHLFGEMGQTTERSVKRRQDLLSALSSLIALHTTIEEEVFYPAFKKAAKSTGDGKLFFEALEEHRAAKFVLKDLEQTDPASPSFGGKAKVLKELIFHHVEEEEEDLFPRAKTLLGKDSLLTLGERMSERRSELLAKPATRRNGRPTRQGPAARPREKQSHV